MNPLITLSALLNLGISRKFILVTVPDSKVVRSVLTTLLYNHLILGYTVLNRRITIALRYANGQPAFRSLALASTGGRSMYLVKNTSLSVPILLSSSTQGIVLNRKVSTSGGKILFFLTF